MGIQLYGVSPKYINYLLPFAPHLFHNKKPGQHNERKYIGIVFEVNGFKYFAPLSSFKPKHQTMKETLDFIKLGRYSVINLNNMFPIPDGQYQYIDISKERDARYKSLLMAEYRIIRVRQDLIRKNAAELYKHKKRKEIPLLLPKGVMTFLYLKRPVKNTCHDNNPFGSNKYGKSLLTRSLRVFFSDSDSYFILATKDEKSASRASESRNYHRFTQINYRLSA